MHLKRPEHPISLGDMNRSNSNLRNYYVVEKVSLEALVQEVNEFIDHGWKPCGGITIVSFPGNITLIQAVARNIE